MADFLPGYEASGWFGLFAPKKTPAEIVDRLNKEINAALADPKVKARLADLGGTVVPGSPADFGKLVVDDKVTANAIGLNVAPTLLTRADEVIE